jgi:uracil-DNA glycosylase
MNPWQQEVIESFRELLYDHPSNDRAFNPYRDGSPELDMDDAAAIRRENLEAYVCAHPDRPRFLVMMEAPGPWGCRFTGIPVTSEAQLLDPAFPLSGLGTSRGNEPLTEYSASIFWRVMQPFFPRFIIWNAFPLHPHKREKPTSIRTPTASEIRTFVPLSRAIVDAIEPETILAVGRKAEHLITKELGLSAPYIRHPSQGGANLFSEGMSAALV